MHTTGAEYEESNGEDIPETDKMTHRKDTQKMQLITMKIKKIQRKKK